MEIGIENSAAYEIYKSSVGGLTWNGEYYELPNNIKKAWKDIDDHYEKLINNFRSETKLMRINKHKDIVTIDTTITKITKKSGAIKRSYIEICMESSIAHEIYKRSVGGLTWNGEKMIEYYELPNNIKKAWKDIDNHYEKVLLNNNFMIETTMTRKCYLCTKSDSDETILHTNAVNSTAKEF